MADTPTAIDTRDKLLEFVRENLPKILEDEPDLLWTALANDRAGFEAQLKSMGFSVSERSVIHPDDVVRSHRAAMQSGVLDNGFGQAIRARCSHRRYEDPRDGRVRRTFIVDEEQEDLAFAWFRAFFRSEKFDPVTQRPMREIHEDLEKFVRRRPGERAPTDPFTGDIGDAGGSLVPTIVQAEIFEIMNEAFPLKGKLSIFESAAPITLNRRTVEVTVSRGGGATDITEDIPEVGPVRLSPERVAVIAYVDPPVAQASPVGPVRWIMEQMGEAMAKDDQRVIITGNPTLREPRGVTNLPTSGGQTWDRANTNAYDNTSRATERASMKTAYYSVPQKHRQSRAFAWVGNDDFVRELHSHNDQDEKPFEPGTNGQPERYLNKELVESTALTTSGSATTGIGGDWEQYAWLQNPEGLRMAQTTEGGDAWESDTIGVKVVQRVDGAPVIGPPFVVITSVDV